MPPAAQPVNGATNALGMMYRRVRVEQVVPERGVAIVIDAQGFTTEIPYRVQAGRGRLPGVGEYWYVDRSMGPWIFSAHIATDDDDLNRITGNVTIEGSTHAVGPLHSVAGISTDGPITAKGGITMPQGKYIIRGAATAVAFQNGWGNFGNGYQDVRFIEYADGTAGLIGVADGGTIDHGTVLFNLPAQVRPDAHHTFLCPSAGGTTVQIRVASNGNVSTQNPDPGATWIALSGCRWPIGEAY